MKKGIFGTKKDLKESLIVAALMLIVTASYEFLMYQFVPDFAINWYEFFGTWFTLNAVWLVRTQNIQNWFWGILGVILLGLFFMEIGLPGQQWLQWAYFLPVQVWAWYHWVNGRKGTNELPVTRLSNYGRVLWITVIAVMTIVIIYAIDVFSPGSQYPVLDATVVAASVVAQYLMGLKKMECWILWLGPVNMLSITLFFLAGAYVLTALYIAFFVHALFGVYGWHKESKKVAYENL